MELKKKIALITGSSRGIGAQLALDLSKEGATVIITYNKSKKDAEKVLEKCKKNSKAYLIHLDVSDDQSIIDAYEKLNKGNMLPDILINNSGVLFAGVFEKMSFEKIQTMSDVNFTGLIKTTKTFIPSLKKKKEALILNVASVAPRYSSSYYIAYAATKAGVVNITKGLANELPKKIKVYCISPGLTSTRMTKYLGVSTKKVSKVAINVLKENIVLNSGEDVDVREHF